MSDYMKYLLPDGREVMLSDATKGESVTTFQLVTGAIVFALRADRCCDACRPPMLLFDTNVCPRCSVWHGDPCGRRRLLSRARPTAT